jgi:hypothetical protein
LSDTLADRLRRRAQGVRARGRIRNWEYRQRNLAHGVWFRIRRVLADAQEAFTISPDEADRLLRDGHVPEPCGFEISPEKRLFFVDPARLQDIPDRKPIRVGLGPEFLAASAVALVRFESHQGVPGERT